MPYTCLRSIGAADRRIDLDDVVGAFFLLLQQFQCFVGVAGSDDTVGYLSLDQAAVSVSQISDNAMKSPKEDILSAPRALA